MRRISVIGSSSGAGKTTFARALAARLALPYVELDALHWEANWTMAPPDVFRERVRQAAAADVWVIDGNYSAVRQDIVWPRADTVVWLDLPFQVMFWRMVRRTLRRVRSGEMLWSGNRETLRNSFLGRDSLLLYSLRTYRGRRARFLAGFSLPQNAHLAVYRFRSSSEARRWLGSLTPGSRAASGV